MMQLIIISMTWTAVDAQRISNYVAEYMYVLPAEIDSEDETLNLYKRKTIQGCAFSFSADDVNSYLRFDGTDDSVGVGDGPCVIDSEDGMVASASLGSVSGVRSMIDEIDCLVEPIVAGLGGVAETDSIGVPSASGMNRSKASVLTGYMPSRSTSPSDSESMSSSFWSSWSMGIEPRGLPSVEARWLVMTGGRGAFGS